MTMVRKQIYLERRQEEKLKRLAHDLGVTEAEILRRSVDQFEPGTPRSEEERRKAAEELIAMLRQRMIDVPVGTTEKFNREDAYSERLDRLSH